MSNGQKNKMKVGVSTKFSCIFAKILIKFKIYDMEITGKIISVLEERSGTSSRTGNEWRVASYVLETVEQYPKKMVFEVFGSDRIQTMNIQAGEMLTVKFDVDAHEYNGRWFNSIRAFAVDRNVGAVPPAGAPMGAPVQAPFNAAPFAGAPQQAPAAQPGFAPAQQEDNGDLPF